MLKIYNFFKNNPVLTVIIIIASFLRLYRLNYQSLWLDEIYTMNITNPNGSFYQLITDINEKEGFPYLYFVVLKYLQVVFGQSAIIARGISALFGIFSVIAIYQLGARLFNKNAGLYAAIILTFSEYAIQISQDARPYTLYLFFTIVAYYAFVNFLLLPSKKNAITYGICAGLLLNSSFFGLINLFAQFMMLILHFFLMERNARNSFFRQCMLAGGIGILLFAPNIYKLTTLTGFKSNWIPYPTNDSLQIILNEFIGNSEITLFLFTPLFIYFITVIFQVKQDNSLSEIHKNKKVFIFITLFSWVTVYLVVVSIKSYLDTSIYITRYFTSLHGAIVLVLGIAFAFIKNSFIRNIYALGVVGFMLFNLVVVKKYYTNISKSQFREASQLIIDNNKKNDPVYTELKFWFDFYLNDKDNKHNVQDRPLEDIIAEMRADSTKIKPFWYANAHGKKYELSEESQKFVSEKLYVDYNFTGIDAWAYHFISSKNVAKTTNLSKFSPIQQNNGDAFPYSVDLFENTGESVKTRGWACFENQESSNTVTDVVLIRENTTIGIRLTTLKESRPDVTSGRNSKFNLDSAGFTSTIDITGLESGKYILGIYLVNRNTQKEGLVLTDKMVVKE